MSAIIYVYIFIIKIRRLCANWSTFYSVKRHIVSISGQTQRMNSGTIGRGLKKKKKNATVTLRAAASVGEQLFMQIMTSRTCH